MNPLFNLSRHFACTLFDLREREREIESGGRGREREDKAGI
jgi:hypothetical protein